MKNIQDKSGFKSIGNECIIDDIPLSKFAKQKRDIEEDDTDNNADNILNSIWIKQEQNNKIIEI